MGSVQVSREQHIRFAGDKRLHRFARAARELPVLIGLGKVQRVMRDHDPRDLRRDAAEPLAKTRDLAPRQASPLESPRVRRVDPRDGNLVIRVEGLEVAADVAAVVGQRKGEASENIVERHVVVSGDDDQRAGESPEELARLLKLAAPRALCQVAGNRDDVGTDLPGGVEKRIECRRIDPAEVQVGEMEYGSQAVSRRPPGLPVAISRPCRRSVAPRAGKEGPVSHASKTHAARDREREVGRDGEERRFGAAGGSVCPVGRERQNPAGRGRRRGRAAGPSGPGGER